MRPNVLTFEVTSVISDVDIFGFYSWLCSTRSPSIKANGWSEMERFLEAYQQCQRVSGHLAHTDLDKLGLVPRRGETILVCALWQLSIVPRARLEGRFTSLWGPLEVLFKNREFLPLCCPDNLILRLELYLPLNNPTCFSVGCCYGVKRTFGY